MQNISCLSTAYIVFHPMRLVTPLYLLTLWYIIKNAHMVLYLMRICKTPL
jgi:hypothetical protein